MNLANLILEQENIIVKAKQTLRMAEAEYAKLKEYRKDCEHAFSPPIKGYEQEGGYCDKCGINEVYAYYMKIGKKYKEKG